MSPEMTTTPDAPAVPSPGPSSEVELSVVIPCLNEADTLAICVDKAQRAIRENGIVGEVIVADNGSTDGSQQIAASHGAQLRHELRDLEEVVAVVRVAHDDVATTRGSDA